jgi:hypothetical protein
MLHFKQWINEGWAPGYKGDSSMDKFEKHRISVTVSEPDHPMVSKRKETQQKIVRVSATNKLDARVKAEKHYKKQGYKVHGSEHISVVNEELEEATYQGRDVPLNKPMAGDVKKSKVYVDLDGDGKATKVNFGDKNMTIKKNIPARRKSFRARHNCENPGPKDKARYWSCKAW